MATRVKRTATTQQVADEMGVTARTVKNWIDGGCPHTAGKEGRGRGHRFDLGEVAEWKRAHNITGEPGRPPEVLSPDLEEVRIRKESAMAKNWEHRNAIIEKEYVSAADVRGRWMELVTTARNKLIGLPAGVAPQCEGHDAGTIQGIIESRVNEILVELSDAT